MKLDKIVHMAVLDAQSLRSVIICETSIEFDTIDASLQYHLKGRTISCFSGTSSKGVPNKVYHFDNRYIKLIYSSNIDLSQGTQWSSSYFIGSPINLGDLFDLEQRSKYCEHYLKDPQGIYKLQFMSTNNVDSSISKDDYIICPTTGKKLDPNTLLPIENVVDWSKVKIF